MTQAAPAPTTKSTIAPASGGGRPSEVVPARLVLEDGTVFEGRSFGAKRSTKGEAVFCTGMVGYPESLTDPSYAGQLLSCTFPMIGNYGVPAEQEGEDGIVQAFESKQIWATGLVVNDYSVHYSHWNAVRSLSDWLEEQGVPGIEGVDTRTLTELLRDRGSMLGRIDVGDDIGKVDGFDDPNVRNLVAEVSTTERLEFGSGDRTVALIDCGVKHNIVRSLISRGTKVVVVPWDDDLAGLSFDGLMVSNGPGDPALVDKAVETVRAVLAKDIPTFGVCMGNQILSQAIGAKTFKLKYGHRGQNQPVVECGTNRCFVTSQNHGYAVDTASLPADWRPWFENLNDGTNEGVRHSWKPFRSVQFHPEANPGPVDTAYLFDEFVRMMHQA
ncbi:MAG: glutamine-hydrolyzing carbamoyl-phosphate synthase small subunit [Planctomycetota bacterium]